MSKSLDTKLAKFTDSVLEGKFQDEPEYEEITEDIASLRDIIVNLHAVGNSHTRRESQQTILKSLKREWPQPKINESVSWRSNRQRQTSMSMAIAFATIVIIAIIIPQVQTTGGEITGAAMGDYLIPLLFVLGSIMAVYLVISKKKGK